MIRPLLVLALCLASCAEDAPDPSLSAECVDARQRYVTARYHFDRGVEAGWTPTTIAAQRAVLDRFIAANWQCFE